MKFGKKKTEEFKPFDFTITVENEQEARLLHYIFNMPEKSIDAIENVFKPDAPVALKRNKPHNPG